jgi:hypothetical protein
MMQFSWRGVLLAPAVVPAFVGIAAAVWLGEAPIVAFLLSFIIASFVSYSVTIFVFLPVLFVVSRVYAMNGLKTSILGLVLGLMAYIPWTMIVWKSSGPDSGPPEESYIAFLLRWDFGPFTLVFMPAGLVTAALYWWLGRSRASAP